MHKAVIREEAVPETRNNGFAEFLVRAPVTEGLENHGDPLLLRLFIFLSLVMHEHGW